MFTFLVVIHIIACTILVVTVLLQQGKGAEVGAVFGASEAIFGSSGPATLLSKVTTASAIVFMLTSLSLTYLSIHDKGESVMQKVRQAPVMPLKVPGIPSVPEAETVKPKPISTKEKKIKSVKPIKSEMNTKSSEINSKASVTTKPSGKRAVTDTASASTNKKAGAGQSK